MRPVWVTPLVIFGGALVFPQTPPKFFELQLPEFQDRVFDSGVIELPVQNLSRLVIHVLNPLAEKVPYGKIYPKLNGDSAAIICQYRSTDLGKAVFMDLKMRPDMHLISGNNTLEITVVDQRQRHYYKNWILRTREQSRNEWFAYDYSISPNDEAGMAPDLLLMSPEYPIVIQGEKPQRIPVRGMVSATSPVTMLTINGGRLALSDAPKFQQDLTVSPNDKQVVIEAVDQKGNRSRVTVPVTHQTAFKPAKMGGDRYALVIGISRYKYHPGGPPDAYAASADAQSFGSVLTSKAGFERDHVLMLLDDKATSAQIRSAFRNFVALAKKDDMLLIYFDGYGMHDPFEPDKMYLAAYDTNSKQLADTALALGEIETLLGANVRCRSVVLLFEVGRDPGNDWKFGGSNLVNAYLLRLASSEQGRAVMVSASVNQHSRDVRAGDGYESIFARWLDEALEGKADWNHDGIVTAAEMFRYVASKVSSETNGEQSPRFQLANQELPMALAGTK